MSAVRTLDARGNDAHVWTVEVAGVLTMWADRTSAIKHRDACNRTAVEHGIEVVGVATVTAYPIYKHVRA